jgi:small subunit ribosomal protein S20
LVHPRPSTKILVRSQELVFAIAGGKTLANIRSQIKRNRQNDKRRLRNRDYRGTARSAVKKALASIAAGEESQATVAAAARALDKAARKGSIHHRNAGRRKSRLVKRLAALGLVSPAPSMDANAQATEPASAPKKAAAGKRKGSAGSKPKAKTTVAKKTTRKSAAKKTTKK